jgi:hypothetical protein
MKKLLIVIMCLPIICFGALFDRPDTNVEPTYGINELNIAFGHLETYYADCSLIFKTHGTSIELCDVVYEFSKEAESRAQTLVLSSPSITEQDWRDQLYAQFDQMFPASKYADMFSALTQLQFDVFLTRVIWWVDEYDDTRTFSEFKTVLTGD